MRARQLALDRFELLQHRIVARERAARDQRVDRRLSAPESKSGSDLAKSRRKYVWAGFPSRNGSIATRTAGRLSMHLIRASQNSIQAVSGATGDSARSVACQRSSFPLP